MSVHYSHKGSYLVFYAPQNGVKACKPIVIGDTFAIPAVDAGPGEKFAAAISGVWHMPKKIGEDIPQGVTVYWNEDQQLVTRTPDGGHKIGFATTTASGVHATLEVLLA